MEYITCWDTIKQQYFLYIGKEEFIVCSKCSSSIIIGQPVYVHYSSKPDNKIYCPDCFSKTKFITRSVSMDILAYVTDSMIKQFKVVKTFDPVISNGAISIWETDKLEGRKIDRTVYANTMHSLEGASIGAEITDNWRDKPIAQAKQIDSFYSDRGTPIRPGDRSPQDQLDALEWERNHSNATTDRLDNKKQEVL